MMTSADVSINAEASACHLVSAETECDRMITCCIQYTLDPRKVDAFENYASRWPPIIERCGGDLIGYYLPKEGANNFALALIDFQSLAAYETYRRRLGRRHGGDAERCRCAEGRLHSRREPLVPSTCLSSRSPTA
jgi:hypothetical protein